MFSIDDFPLSPINHEDIRQLCPDDQRLLITKILFERNLNLIDTEYATEEDITFLICLFNSTLPQLDVQSEDQQLCLRDGATFLEKLYAILADKLLEMFNKLAERYSEDRDSNNELISSLDKQIATLKKSIKSIDPTYSGDTLDEDTSPSTPSKRPRLVDSGNSALSSSIDTMVG